ncbi:amidohydrolase family protein [Saccharothrix coeruleofusca]|uniref:Amidohydrolase n=1 Tax=Saccharothrix coeruleofusca TaxID=33919 RepID=A0A918AML5_9PSEU|nr:amidohydrolase family protein [Saccharothrix coeruleofusca]MBP2338197.1 putative TIM-barrel fold metal-dependent hydrolase [Saccharothrix coeruleofusca]GGP50084.1 amidohydrolase [Saccharothrix coeruleofusca]
MNEKLRIVGLEEHVLLPVVLEAWEKAGLSPNVYGPDHPVTRRLLDVGQQRLADMDDQGIDVAVLSLSTPGVQNLAPAEAVSVAREANDALAEIVEANPRRFQAFAAIPTSAPEAAAAELERAIGLGFRGAMLYGRTGDKLADAPEFDDLYATAERLRVPLHFHPQTPVRAVQEAYYSGLPNGVGPALATAGLGWYYDLGVQYLRMIFSGVFDRHPELQVIAGHWGEVVLFYLDHVGFLREMAGLPRPLADYFRQNFWIAGSGTVSERYLRWTAEVVGTDRMLYSTDYPYTFGTRPGGFPHLDTSGGVARSFLEQAPFTDEEKAAIGSGNWERLTGHLAAPHRQHQPS